VRTFGPSGGQGTTENVTGDGLPSTTLSGNRSPTIRTVQFPTQVEGVLPEENRRIVSPAAKVSVSSVLSPVGGIDFDRDIHFVGQRRR